MGRVRSWYGWQNGWRRARARCVSLAFRRPTCKRAGIACSPRDNRGGAEEAEHGGGKKERTVEKRGALSSLALLLSSGLRFLRASAVIFFADQLFERDLPLTTRSLEASSHQSRQALTRFERSPSRASGSNGSDSFVSASVRPFSAT